MLVAGIFSKTKKNRFTEPTNQVHQCLILTQKFLDLKKVVESTQLFASYEMRESRSFSLHEAPLDVEISNFLKLEMAYPE